MNQDRFKFRAWDINWLRMKYQGFTINPTTGKVHWTDETWLEEETDQLIPMQSTGLKDSEGKLIYEGDLVSVVLNQYYTCCTCEIVFKGMGFWFKDEDGELFVFHPDTYKVTVIGNIYENPSLI